MLEYSQIFKQALTLIRNNKFLWVFGLFLSLGGIFNFFSFSRNGSGEYYQKQSLKINLWFSNHPNQTLLIAAVIILLFLLLVYVYFRAKAGIIIAIKAILDKQATGFSQAFRAAQFFYLRILRVFILLALLLVLAFLVLAAPVIYLFVSHYELRALMLLVLALIIFIPLSVVVYFISSLAPLFIVMNDLTATEAIKAGFDLFKKFWSQLIVFSLFLMVLNVAAFFVMFLLVILSSLVVFFFHLLYHIPAGLNHVLTGLGILAGSVIFLIIQAGLAVFQQAAWLLVFDELVKAQKLEEPAPETAPEIVS